jgi:hypothetical protein
MPRKIRKGGHYTESRRPASSSRRLIPIGSPLTNGCVTSVRRRLTISVSEIGEGGEQNAPLGLSGSRPGADRFDIQIAARFASSNQFDSNSRSRSNSGSDKIFNRDRWIAAIVRY